MDGYFKSNSNQNSNFYSFKFLLRTTIQQKKNLQV